MMKRIARDLGDANIPKVMIQQVVPSQLRALWWREESTNPAHQTVEIWGSETQSFFVIAGDFIDGEWGQSDVQFIGEFEDLDKALAAARSNFVIKEDELPDEQKVASNSFKRLIRKN